MSFALETAVRKLMRIEIPPKRTLSGFIHTSIILHNTSFVLDLRLCKTFFIHSVGMSSYVAGLFLLGPDEASSSL
jgi:hypothetical protein